MCAVWSEMRTLLIYILSYHLSQFGSSAEYAPSASWRGARGGLSRENTA